MGLRCSLLGHDYGDVVVERDRQERGEEVVVTERELRECNRCGAEEIYSENTEVRRRRPDEYENADSDRTESDSLVQEAEDEAAEEMDDAIILDDGPADDEPVSEPSAEESAAESTAAEAATESPAADAEPLADETATADEGETASEPQQAESSWPESGQEQVHEDDADIEREWPNDPRDPSERAEESVFQFPDDAEESNPRSGITSAGPIETTKPVDDNIEGSLTCPACGFSVRMKRSSLRAGDICPDCHEGYLAEGR